MVPNPILVSVPEDYPVFVDFEHFIHWYIQKNARASVRGPRASLRRELLSVGRMLSLRVDHSYDLLVDGNFVLVFIIHHQFTGGADLDLDLIAIVIETKDEVVQGHRISYNRSVHGLVHVLFL